MTSAARPAPAPGHPCRRGAGGQAEGDPAGDLAGCFAALQTILRLEAIRLAAEQQLLEIRSAGDPVTGVIPGGTVVAHLRRLRRYREQLNALLGVEGNRPRPRGRRCRGDGAKQDLTKQTHRQGRSWQGWRPRPHTMIVTKQSHHPTVGARCEEEPREGATMPMMDMCRHMMAGPATGMSADPKMDPTMKMDPAMMAHILEMRGEMMKAMGEIMVKHGKMMRGGATN